MSVTFAVSIGGNPIAPRSFSVTGSTFGSVGHATINTGITALAGVDLFDLTTGSAGVTEVYINATIDGATTRLFGGEHLSTEWDFDADSVVIHARSWGGILVDQKRILSKIGAATTAAFKALAPGRVTAAGISHENQTVGNIVSSIASEFGFTPVLNMTNGNPTVGTLYGAGAQTFMPVPQSLWSTLNQLARDTGYVVYDTPNKELVFGEAGAGLPTVALGYKLLGAPVPTRYLRVTHHPRRNSTFRVLVVSYDAARRAVNLGRANYVGRDQAGSAGLPAGLSTGAQAVANDAKIAALKLNVTKVPLYTFHHDGLTQDQATTMASSIATDIAKRELILSASMDGYGSLSPSQPVKVSGAVPDSVAAATFFISGYTHTFRMPSRSHSEHDGFTTEIKALNIPTDALATENAG